MKFARHPARAGADWTDEELLDAIRLWTRLHDQPPRWLDWTPSRLRERGTTPRPGVLEGHWPSAPRPSRPPSAARRVNQTNNQEVSNRWPARTS